MKKIALLFGLLLLTIHAISNPYPQKAKTSAYTTPLRRPPAPADFFGKPEEYLNWQAQNLLDMVEEISYRSAIPNLLGETRFTLAR